MICSRCGKEIPDDSVFCNYCGTSLKDNKSPRKPKEKKAPSVMFIFFDISIGAALMIASVLIYFYSDYDAIGNAKYVFLALHLIVVPILCLLLILKGFIGIYRIKKEDRKSR